MTFAKRNRQLLAISVSLMCFAPLAANAQAAGSNAASDQTTSDQAGGLQEIVVTAQRRAENLQQTPIAITALSPSVLESRNVVSTQDLMQVTPGLQVSTQAAGNGGGSATFFIRGMGQLRSGNGTSPAVGIYVDNFYYPSLQGSIFSVLDIEQIEVLRGPQGTLFGRNSIGGAIRYSTVAPKFDAISGYIKGTIGNLGRRDVNGVINLPLSDWAALRLTAAHLENDGYVRQQNGGPDAGGSNTNVIRGQLRIEPASNLDVRLAAQYNRTKLDGFAYYAPSPITPAVGSLPFRWNQLPMGQARPYDSRYASQCDYCQAGGDKREFSDNRYFGATGTIAWDLSDAFKLTSLTGWQSVRSDYLRDLDGSPLPINNSSIAGLDLAFSQELQLNGKAIDDRLSFVLGGYLYNERHRDRQPKGGDQVLLGGTTPTVFLESRSLTKAAFIDATFELTPAVKLIGGFRYSVDSKSADIHTRAGVLLASIKKNFESTTWRAGVQVQATSDVMGYATVSRGFRAGGFGKISNTATTLDAFDPETATNYEIGARMDLFDRRLRFNPTVFYTTWSDIQLQRVSATQAGIQIFVDNAAKAHSKGVELETQVVVTDRLSLTGSLALLDMAYDEIGTGTTSITLDSKFQRAPKVTYSIGADYHMNIGDNLKLAASANYSFQDNQSSSPADRDALMLPSYGLLSARLQLGDRENHWSIAAYASNITDEVYYIGGNNFSFSSGNRQFDLGRPREAGLTLKVGF